MHSSIHSLTISYPGTIKSQCAISMPFLYYYDKKQRCLEFVAKCGVAWNINICKQIMYKWILSTRRGLSREEGRN